MTPSTKSAQRSWNFFWISLLTMPFVLAIFTKDSRSITPASFAFQLLLVSAISLVFFGLIKIILRKKYYVLQPDGDHKPHYEYMGENRWVEPTVLILTAFSKMMLGWLVSCIAGYGYFAYRAAS